MKPVRAAGERVRCPQAKVKIELRFEMTEQQKQTLIQVLQEYGLSIIGRGKMTSKVSPERPEGRFPCRLRAAARIAVLTGAAGSIGLWFHASQHPPLLIVVLFVIWVLSPFAALLLADVVSKRWSVLTRAALHSVMLVVTAGSLANYVYDTLRPRKAQAAFWYVLVPPASWLLIAIVVLIAAIISGRMSRRGDRA